MAGSATQDGIELGGLRFLVAANRLHHHPGERFGCTRWWHLRLLGLAQAMAASDPFRGLLDTMNRPPIGVPFGHKQR